MTIETPEDVLEDLFKDVTFYICGEISDQVIDLLTKYGGKRDTYLSEMVSHVIADDVENSDYQEARELFELPCVMSEWVLYSVKLKKMLDKELFAPEERLFSGVVACASKLEEGDWLSLWGMIVYNGGRCQTTLTNKCTHLITPLMEGRMYEEGLKHEDNLKIVTPDWIADCIEKEERQDELVYHPRFIEIPKPPSPPKPPTPPPPPKPEPMEITPPMPQEIPKPTSDKCEEVVQGSRPVTPGSASTKEALAKLVNNRMQDIIPPRGQAPQNFPQGQFEGQGHRFPGPFPGHPQGAGPQHGHPGGNGNVPFLRPGQQPRPSPQGFPQGHPQALHMQHPGPRGIPPHSQHSGPIPAQGPGPGQPKLRNITNNMEMFRQQQHAHQMQQQQHQQQQQQQQQMKTAQNKMPFPGPHQIGNKLPPPQYGPQQGFPGQQQQQQQWPQFWGHDPSENIPPDMCLLGCIFYINDYPKIVGMEQIAIWKRVIEQHGGQVDPSYSNRVTHVMCANQSSDVYLLALRDQRRIVTAFWLNDVLVKKKLLPPWQALHIPLLYSEENKKPCSNQIISLTNFDGDDRVRVKQMIHALGAKYTGYMSRTNSALVCRRPDGVKYQKAKEWRTPVVNVQWLSDLLLGHMDALSLPIHSRYLQVGQGDEFLMDVNKVLPLMVNVQWLSDLLLGHMDALSLPIHSRYLQVGQGDELLMDVNKLLPLMAAWKTPLKVTKETWKKILNMKKTLQPSALGQENIPTNPNHSPAKKQRLEEDVKIVMNGKGPRILFTGFPRGITKRLHMMINQLGGNVVENAQFCTHLVAQSFSRTMKFFVAINVCQFVVSRQWIEDSHQKGGFQPESLYMLHDPAGEAEIKCSLAESLRRAHCQRLFGGLTFYISPSVQPPISDLRKIVESAGGVMAKKRPGAPIMRSLVDNQGNPSFLVITCADDIHLFEDLIDNKIKMYTAEFVLTGVLRQERNFAQFQIEMQR